MRTSLASLAAAATLAAMLVLAVAPQSYRSPAGCSPRETPECYESVVVDCGIALNPKNPPPPPGTDDQCDAQHVRRWVTISMVFVAGMLVTSGFVFVRRVRRRDADGS